MSTAEHHLLIVANRPSENTRLLAESVVAGAREVAENTKVTFLDPLDASASDVQNASGIIVGSTENFGAMAGLIKDFFERIYYPCLEQTQGLPCALYIRAGLDGAGTQQGLERIITGLRWKPIQPTLLLHGTWQDSFRQQNHELGQLMAAGLETGVF